VNFHHHRYQSPKSVEIATGRSTHPHITHLRTSGDVGKLLDLRTPELVLPILLLVRRW
jgi:hypothetical protein